MVNVVAGTLSDVYGRKALLIASGFFIASAPFLYLLVTNPLQLIAVRVYHGVATAVFTPVAAAAVADAYAERRGEAMGLLSSATLVGRLIAPFSAGLFISFYSFRGAYLFCAAVGVAAFITLTTVPPLPRPRHGAPSAVRSLSEAPLNPHVLAVGTAMAAVYFALQSIETFLPIHLKAMGMATWLIGAVLSMKLGIMALVKPYGGRLYDRAGPGRTVVAGALIAAAGLAALAASPSYHLVAASIVSSSARGAALGAMETIKDVGQALGPIVTGGLLMAFPPSVAFLAASAVVLMAAPIALVAARRVRPLV